MRKLLAFAVSCSALVAVSNPSFAAEPAGQPGAKHHIAEGEIWAKAGNWNSAYVEFRSAVQAEPKNLIAHYDLGVACAHLDRLEEAAAAEREVIKLKPDYVPAYVELSYILMRVNDLAGAESAIRQALQLDPDNRAARNNLLAISQKRRINRQPGPAQIRAPQQTPPKVAIARPAHIMVPAGDSGKATPNRDMGVAAATPVRESAESYANRAWGLANQGDWQDAGAVYQQALMHNPEDLNAQVGHALAQGNNGEATAAAEALRRLAEGHPARALPHIALGSLLSGLGKYDEAVAQLETAVKLEPGNLEARRRLASVLLRQGKVALALPQYQVTLRLAGRGKDNSRQQAEDHVGLGLCLFERDPDGALSEFRKAVAIAGENQLARKALSLALEACGRAQSPLESLPIADSPQSAKELAASGPSVE